MKNGRVTIGIRPEVYAAARPQRSRKALWMLLRVLVVTTGLAGIITLLAMTTDLEELFLPHTVILRGNRLSPASEVIELAGMPASINTAVLIPGRKDVPEGKSRWIKAYSTRMLPGRRMLLSVDERMPLLPLELGGNAYWICSDGEIVLRNPELDSSGRFEELSRLPMVSMSGSGIDAEYAVTDMLLLTAGQCRDLLDSRIKGIEVTPGGEFNLITDKGLKVMLGVPEDEEYLRYRISALSKAIRISDQYKDAKAIDLRNGKVAYLRTSTSE